MSQKYLPRENPAIYEINTLSWLFELSRKLGRPVHLRDVPPEEWDRLKALGMDFVWLMGVWSRSPSGRNISLHDPHFHRLFDAILPGWTDQDVVGSAYAISSYQPDPAVGGWEDLDFTRRELHRRNMGLILDFIPNHTGINHHWLSEHPEYFIQGTEEDYRRDKNAFFPVTQDSRTLYIARGRDPNFPPWTDTAQLNYFNPETRGAMIGQIKEIARHCDGVRCDMAMLILNDSFKRVWGWANRLEYQMTEGEFWAEATQQVPDLVYIAEAYWDTEWTLQQLGFDFVYDKRLYDRLKGGRPQEVYLHLKAEMAYQKKLVRFIENHDELRSVTAFGPHKTLAAAVLFSGLPGMKLYFHGQMEGRQIHLPLQIRQSRPEAVDLQIKAFYEKLLPEVNQEVFHTGVWQLVDVLPESDNTAENLIGYTLTGCEPLRLTIVNLSQHPSRGRVRLPALSPWTDYSLTERLSGQSLTQDGRSMTYPGLLLSLEGYQGQIWEVNFNSGG
jgi:hypothetical protein